MYACVCVVHLCMHASHTHRITLRFDNNDRNIQLVLPIIFTVTCGHDDLCTHPPCSAPPTCFAPAQWGPAERHVVYRGVRACCTSVEVANVVHIWRRSGQPPPPLPSPPSLFGVTDWPYEYPTTQGVRLWPPAKCVLVFASPRWRRSTDLCWRSRKRGSTDADQM